MYSRQKAREPAQYRTQLRFAGEQFDNLCLYGTIRTARAARRVHECVFGVFALEIEPVDPRLRLFFAPKSL